MKITWVGVGGAFATKEQWQTNAVLTSKTGKNLLLDCGGDVRHSTAEAGFAITDIDGVYISHLHGDHSYGAEWLAFLSYFHPGYVDRPHLYIVDALLGNFWSFIKESVESLEGKVANLDTYFRAHPITINDSFEWEGITLTPVQTVHVVSGYGIKHSYGLIIKEDGTGEQIFWTADTQFSPRQIEKFYLDADVIFHDCETLPLSMKSNVHSHYEDLRTLMPEIKKKMWLTHYSANPVYDAEKDGFAGFVQKGQVFEF
jgi:ribonuclease BN (tRNA processing enzyme)